MQNLSDLLLDWYDQHARVLPWRTGPGDRKAGTNPDPYDVWLSEIMLQQTTVAAVKAYFNRFKMRWPTVEDLANADDDEVLGEWAGLGYYARARNLLKCARQVVARGGFPESEAELRSLPGVGPYTAAAVASIAFDEPAPVMDGNVERVMSRFYAINDPLPGSKPRLYELAAGNTPSSRSGDYAQAVMDLGATVCTPKKPSCMICPVQGSCQGYAQGEVETLPRKTPKAPKPTRYGHIYVARRADGAILIEKRPERGLLGGMSGFPGTIWSEDLPEQREPMPALWQTHQEPVTHVFTHFRLSLTVHAAHVPITAKAEIGEFVLPDKFSTRKLPTVMRKAFDRAITTLESVEIV